MYELTYFILPLISALLLFKIVGRSLLLWQYPKERTKRDYFMMLIFVSELFLTVEVTLRAPFRILEFTFLLLFLGLLMANWYEWGTLFGERKKEIEDLNIRLTLEGKTLGEIAKSGQPISLTGIVKTVEEQLPKSKNTDGQQPC